MRSAPLAAAVLLLAASIAGAQPVNDDCADATVIASLPFTDAVDTTAATTEAGDPTFDCDSNSYGQEARSVWYRYTSAAGGPVEIDTFGSDYDTILTVWRGTCGALGGIAACNDGDWDAASSFSDESRLVVTLGAGETIRIEVLSGDPPGGNLVLNVKESAVFQVSDETVYSSEFPDVAAAADGTFVVVWEQEDDYTVVGRRFCDTGAPLGPPFQIGAPGDPEDLAWSEPVTAASSSSGSMTSSSLLGRRLSATGTPLGTEFEISAANVSYYDFGLAADATGRFVVAWHEFDGDGDEAGIVAQRFDASNAPLGGTFVVNTFTTGYQRSPNVASDAAGNFVVTWASDEDQDGYGFGIFGQRYDSTGAAAGGEFQVNVSTSGSQTNPAATFQPGGEFVITWLDEYQDCGQACVVGRRYDGTGTALGGEFVVSDGTSGPPTYYVSIDSDASATGEFAVAWADENDFPRARAFDADTTPQGLSFQAGLIEDDYQRNVRMAMADDGDFVVVWDWAAQGSNYRIMARTVTTNPSCPAPAGCPPSPQEGCKQPTIEFKGNLTLKDKDPDDRDAAIWKWVRGEATSVAEIGDALATDTYKLCVYDGTNTLLGNATVAPGGTCGPRPCWKDLGGQGFKYVDKTGEHGIVRKLVLKSGDEGRAKVIAKAQGDDLAIASLPPALPVRAQVASTTGTCWEAEFRAEGVTKSTPTVFGAKPSLGSPGAAFLD